MWGADAGNPARDDLAALRDKGIEQSGVLIVDIVDLLDAEPAHLLAPEVLLLGGHRLVATGWPLRCADGTAASLFWHDVLLLLLFRSDWLWRRGSGMSRGGSRCWVR